MHKVAVIVGSTRPGRVGIKIGHWAINHLQPLTDELQLDLVDLAEINLPFLDEPKSASTGEYTQEHTRRWSELISNYDAFILVTSEYNHGPPAPLKNALDFLAHEWSRKPVSFIGYGGMGGTRAVTMLRVITSELGMVPVWSAIHVRAPWDAVDENGEVDMSFVNGNPQGFVDELTWWTKALASARSSE